MESLNLDFKKLSVKKGKNSRNEYIDSFRKQQLKFANTKSYDISFQNLLKHTKNVNITGNTSIIKSSSIEKDTTPKKQIISTKNINSVNNKIIKHKKTNSVTIEINPQDFKKKEQVIKISPQKKQTKVIYKRRNTSNSDNIHSNINSKEKVKYEPINQNDIRKEKEKEISTLSTSQVTNPEKINNESFEKYDTIIISKDDNRRAKFFIKTTRNKLKNSASFNYLNTINYTDNKCLSSRNYNIEKKNIGKKMFNTDKKVINTYIGNFNSASNFFIHKDLCLNIEDLIMIEDKFSKLIKAIHEENNNLVNKLCFEWWNFYFNCSFKGNCNYLFNESRNKNVITYHNSLLLISIILIYDISIKSILFSKLIDFMKKIIILNYQNYLYICLILINRIKTEYLHSKWVEQLKEIIYSKISNKTLLINQIEKNLFSLNQLLSTVISVYNNKNALNPKIQLIYKNYSKYDSDTLNKIFMSDILHIENQGGSIVFSSKKQSNPLNYSHFLKNPPLKDLTLILDLDETIMSFIYINDDNQEGLLRIRPYLYNFLNLVKEYYEIVIFTTATQNYADPIIDNIEIRRGKYFNYRLYREHCTIINNDIIKDISLLGRDLSKIIIVDNIQQNFKLQKENGILISSFWGEDDNDKVLLQLGRILVSIAIDMIQTDYNLDVRDEIKKFKEDIIKNVSIS